MPLAKEVVAPTRIAPSKILIVTAASAVPEIVGVARRFGLGTESVGTRGARVSIRSSKIPDETLVKAPLRARAVSAWKPSLKGAGGR